MESQDRSVYPSVRIGRVDDEAKHDAAHIGIHRGHAVGRVARAAATHDDVHGSVLCQIAHRGDKLVFYSTPTSMVQSRALRLCGAPA